MNDFLCVLLLLFFFFKQKTAYEMRISDLSSDVCSSDLKSAIVRPQRIAMAAVCMLSAPSGARMWAPSSLRVGPSATSLIRPRVSRDASARGTFSSGRIEVRDSYHAAKIGRAPCRERVCKYV